jgi:hypothetical protein
MGSAHSLSINGLVPALFLPLKHAVHVNLERTPHQRVRAHASNSVAQYDDYGNLQEQWGIVPLLNIDLEFADGQVVCRPSVEQTAEAIMTQLDDMAKQVIEVQDDCLGAVNNSLNPPAVTEDGWASDPMFIYCRHVSLLGLSRAGMCILVTFGSCHQLPLASSPQLRSCIPVEEVQQRCCMLLQGAGAKGCCSSPAGCAIRAGHLFKHGCRY